MAGSPFIEFERTKRRGLGELNLTPLIDILFILIIFFMLTTSFMRIESMELILPSAAGKAADKDDVVHLFLYANGDMAIGRRIVDRDGLMESLSRLLEKGDGTKIMLLSADGVTVQQLVGVMDRITTAGGKSLFVRKWENPPPGLKATKVDEPPRKPDIRDLWGE